MKVLVEGVELYGIPAYADAKDQPASAEHVYLGGLLGDERGLPLRQDDDAGDELDPSSNGGGPTEEDKDLVEVVVYVVEEVHPDVLVVGCVRAEDVVVYYQAVEAHLLAGLDEFFGGSGVGANLGLGENYAKFHVSLLSAVSMPVLRP